MYDFHIPVTDLTTGYTLAREILLKLRIGLSLLSSNTPIASPLSQSKAKVYIMPTMLSMI